MKTKFSVVFIVALITMLLIYACSSEERFTYYLQNASHYTIDSGKLNQQHFQLKANEVAGPFELTIENGLTSFSEPMLSLDVAVFSDANGRYSLNEGVTGNRGIMQDDGTYLIRVIACGDSTQVRFDFEIEEADIRKQYSRPRK